MNKASVYQQIVLNAIPLVGYWYLDWSMFAIVYLYWVEALVISLFVFMKIAMARGPEKDGSVTPAGRRVYSAFKIMLLRVGILMFYWIFILLFVAMGQGKYTPEQTMDNLMILAFANAGFNLAVLAFFLSQLTGFISNFIISDAFRQTSSSSHKLFFDARTVVIHVVVVVGTFAYQYLKPYESVDNRIPGLGFVLVLFLIKTLADIFIHLVESKKIIPALQQEGN